MKLRRRVLRLINGKGIIEYRETLSVVWIYQLQLPLRNPHLHRKSAWQPLLVESAKVLIEKGIESN